MYEYFELHILRKLPIECFDKMVIEAGAGFTEIHTLNAS